MLVYPDSSDLIDLCRRTAGINISHLAETLSAQSHKVVFSFDTLIEVAAPLRDGHSLEVRRDLNQLEELPHVFVNEGRIRDMEIREALSAFEQQREYDFAAVTPFASRLDSAIDVHGTPQYVVERMGARPISVRTEMIVNFRIWEIIRYVWTCDPDAFNVQRRLEPDWISLLESDRMMARPPTLPDHFVTVMRRDLETHGIRPPAAGAEPFARWVYESPVRCPGVRLAYETYHQFRRNQTARPRASDLIDLARIASIPYVEFFVTDAAMMNYCKQAADEIGCRYQQLFGNFRAVMSYLNMRAAAC
jgi:hypothetical protein